MCAPVAMGPLVNNKRASGDLNFIRTKVVNHVSALHGGHAVIVDRTYIHGSNAGRSGVEHQPLRPSLSAERLHMAQNGSAVFAGQGALPKDAARLAAFHFRVIHADLCGQGRAVCAQMVVIVG